MTELIRPDLWEVTLPAVKAGRARAKRHIESGKRYPRLDVPQFRVNEQGWSLTTDRETVIPSAGAPPEWRKIFSPSESKWGSELTFADVPELADAANRVSRMAMEDPQFESRMSYISQTEEKRDRRRAQIEYEYAMFVGEIIGRAEFQGSESDADLVEIYAALERARFAQELTGDLVVPLSLTAFDFEGRFEVSEDIYIEELDESMQRARALPMFGSGKVSALVVAAATHAVVIRGVTVPNSDFFRRTLFDPPLDFSRVDAVVQCLHIASGKKTGYAQALMRPHGWADHWTHDLPAVSKVGTFQRYPPSFDDGGWLEEKDPIPAEVMAKIPQMLKNLEASPANVQLASRRSIRSMMRDADEDRTLDATIGMEALLLGDTEKEGVTHRMAERAAAVLASDGMDPEAIYELLKKVYGHRSQVVHGRVKIKENIGFQGRTYTAQEVATFLLRALLANLLASDELWTAKTLDKRILQSLRMLEVD